MKRLVIFASGSGSNAQNIIEYFGNENPEYEFLVLSNKKDAAVLERAAGLGVSAMYFNKQAFATYDHVLNLLNSLKPDLIILAGFLWKIPDNIVKAFPDKIINIHPALLPKHGGKGMYGMRVHQAVKDHRDKETGITIHFVNEHYDEGNIIFQAKTPVLDEDTPETIAQKVHALEYQHFPQIIEKLLNEQI